MQYKFSLNDVLDCKWKDRAPGVVHSFLDKLHLREGVPPRSVAKHSIIMLDVVTLLPAPEEKFLVYYILANVTAVKPRPMLHCLHMVDTELAKWDHLVNADATDSNQPRFLLRCALTVSPELVDKVLGPWDKEGFIEGLDPKATLDWYEQEEHIEECDKPAALALCRGGVSASLKDRLVRRTFADKELPVHYEDRDGPSGEADQPKETPWPKARYYVLGEGEESDRLKRCCSAFPTSLQDIDKWIKAFDKIAVEDGNAVKARTLPDDELVQKPRVPPAPKAAPATKPRPGKKKTGKKTGRGARKTSSSRPLAADPGPPIPPSPNQDARVKALETALEYEQTDNAAYKETLATIHEEADKARKEHERKMNRAAEDYSARAKAIWDEAFHLGYVQGEQKGRIDIMTCQYEKSMDMRLPSMSNSSSRGRRTSPPDSRTTEEFPSASPNRRSPRRHSPSSLSPSMNPRSNGFHPSQLGGDSRRSQVRK